MGAERLIGLALMECHRQLVTQLDQDQLVHKLARRQPRHMTLVNIFQEWRACDYVDIPSIKSVLH